MAGLPGGCAGHCLAVLRKERVLPPPSVLGDSQSMETSLTSCVGAGSCTPAGAGRGVCLWQSREASGAACKTGAGAQDAVS